MKRLFPYLAVSLGAHAVVLLLVLAGLTWVKPERGHFTASQPRPGVVLVDFAVKTPGAARPLSQARTDTDGFARLRPPMPTAAGGSPASAGAASDAEAAGDLVIHYPELSRQFGEEGRVEFLLFLNAAGAVDRAEITRTSGHPRLDTAALEAVSRAQFKPARNMAGSPVASQKPFHVEFRLED